jgi:hypothetical protein
VLRAARRERDRDRDVYSPPRSLHARRIPAAILGISRVLRITSS